MEYDYDFDDLLETYEKLGVSLGKKIYVASDFIRLMKYKDPGKESVLKGHLDSIQQLIGPSGTLFVPTASLNLCNTKIPFDLINTPSFEMGMFSEFIRTHDNAQRSFHPFWSLAGIGPNTNEILENVSRHAYGYGSVWQRFVDNDVISLNIGKHPQFSISIIHYIETIVGVPYRYTKEFVHPVVRNSSISCEPFYLSVLYRNCDIERDKNRKIFDNFEKNGILRMEQLGKRGFAWSFSLSEFFKVTMELFLKDIYSWLKNPPVNRPYQK